MTYNRCLKGTTRPWTGVEVGLNSFFGENDHLIYAKSWVLDPNTTRWMAFKFGFTPVKGWNLGSEKECVDFNNHKYAKFLTEFANIVEKNEWEKLLGLVAWPANGFTGFVGVHPRADTTVHGNLMSSICPRNVSSGPSGDGMVLHGLLHRPSQVPAPQIAWENEMRALD